MYWLGLNEIREKFLAFFESKGHLRLPSFSLIPQDDKSLLLINAGMAPMKKYFTGEITPPRNRVTTCQKCIRTPDIERVGITSRHATYFEMLGNFSFGDYFKREAIDWAWEFCTKVMEMDVDRLYVSVYLDDDEAYDIWVNEIGVAPDHMVRFGKEDNFWDHGAGPCGPCSEIYYDRGIEFGCGSPDCKVGCECDRFVEFWNIVFTQFENDGNNNYTPLEKKNIDTGMGLERLACISQGVANLFEVDTVQNIMKHIIRISGVDYHTDEKSDISLRVITDHIRSTTFMIGDGVMPSNEGRGYVLRRLLRRAARHGRLIGIERPFLAEVAATVIAENASAYPELVDKQDYIVKIISVEEENFGKTIDSGLKLLSDMIENTDSEVLSGDDAFKLSDTFGFPIDLTKEILAEKGMSVDEDRFKALVKNQRDTARAARKDAGADAWKNTGAYVSDLPKTEFVGYTEFKADAKVLAILKDGERVDFISQDESGLIILDTSPFYAESGGQVGDIGKITVGETVADISNTTKTVEGVYLHAANVVSGDGIKVKDVVKASVCKKTRLATMRNHTATHLLHAALREVLGSHVQQAGSYVNHEEVRFDFTHFSAMTREEIEKVENIVNEYIFSNSQVTMQEMPIEEAKNIGAVALFGEKYGDVVRVVRVGDFSAEFCGGTHIDNTSRLGLFKIISESSIAAGVRRITGITGEGVLKYIAEKDRLLADTAVILKINSVNEIATKTAAVVADVKTLEKQLEQARDEISAIKSKSMLSDIKKVGKFDVITANVGDVQANDLKSLADNAKSDNENIVAVFASIANGKLTFCVGCGKEAVKNGANAGNIVRQIAQIAGGSGGGKPDMAMAGGKDVSKIDEALAAVENILA
jgi:alanyl-tRNA synthetase